MIPDECIKKSIDRKIKEMIEENDIVIFMKGDLEADVKVGSGKTVYYTLIGHGVSPDVIQTVNVLLDR